ncbi:galactose-1-epimerase [candidate division KSB3 bacterium]|uniref:Aldose 1-epimerase n=1 Tax=candidate division KSB3 bacterium TaxID=2044937 RepID=A0A2G6KBF5_9BACT|nr:MAG: galactose-1-epimerase [candidate division KSB3 bacterium]
MNIKKQIFGHTREGQVVNLYTLTNDHGSVATITNYGGIVVSLLIPDRQGKLADVVLGFDSFEEYLTDPPYFGALIGRYANRIAQAKFTLQGIEYTLAQNDGDNHLHGGLQGFDKVIWNVEENSCSPEGAHLTLRYLSPDGEEGYPGNLTVTVTYTFTNKNALKIEYTASTDKETVLNLTNHSYFNLQGARSGKTVLDHEVMLNADRFTPGDAGLIPTGELRDIKGTPLDFTESTAIGARIQEEYDQLLAAGGYDHNWVLNKEHTGTLTLAAKVYEPVSGRIMEVHTTEPGIQFYTGNFLDGSITGKGKTIYHKNTGFCLETQHFPNSPNQPAFPSTALKPGEEYRQTTIYSFSHQG